MCVGVCMCVHVCTLLPSADPFLQPSQCRSSHRKRGPVWQVLSSGTSRLENEGHFPLELELVGGEGEGGREGTLHSVSQEVPSLGFPRTPVSAPTPCLLSPSLSEERADGQRPAIQTAVHLT